MHYIYILTLLTYLLNMSTAANG